MVSKTVNKFEVKYLQVLDENGKVDSKLMPKLNPKQIKEIYRAMYLGRVFDDKMLSLQRQGRIGTFAQIKGQEASNVGSAYALQKEDWLFPAFRENASLVLRGVPMENILLYYGGDERGNAYPNGVNCFTTAVPVGSQTLHATGWGMAEKFSKGKRACIVYFGDGATSEGDTNEAMNFAGTFKVPIVFICQNNQYAISVPRSKQSAAETLAQRAIGFGFEGIQVDGNDVFAVYKATKEALDKARKGKGPTMVECLTYRMANHTTADDWKKYRTEKEVKYWEKRDPIDRVRKYMENKKMWTGKDEESMKKQVEKEVADAVERFEKIGKPAVGDMFKYMYKDMPTNLIEQLNSLEKG